MRVRNLLASSLCLLFAAAAFAAAPRLQVGDDAPGLDIEAWVKGDETSLEKGKVYVVEFWATWCAPCRKSIPHLSELQQKYLDQGLTVIGVSDEKEDVVKRFVRKQGKKMDYTVVVDRRKTTGRAWMEAAEQKGIPTAFIVDTKGKIQFIGHPLSDEFEQTLAQVINGRYDAKLHKRVQPMYTAAKNARKVRNWRMADKMLDDIIKEDPHVFAFMNFDKFEMMLIDQDDPAAAYTFARKLSAEYADDAEFLRRFAEKIATDPNIAEEDRDLAVALELAKASARSDSGNDPDALAVQALVHYHAGQIEEAIALQKRAYFMARPKSKDRYQRVLRTYQAAAQRESSLGG